MRACLLTNLESLARQKLAYSSQAPSVVLSMQALESQTPGSWQGKGEAALVGALDNLAADVGTCTSQRRCAS